ncbi:FAD-binding oxidoreductase [Prescottella equi]|uniref:FAD-binding protein n=1 Tax=Rhodococcus hoagii TaxID=43767 RepID=A0AAE5MH81_RHOHA|nr:FAD-binding oxidoreductase [Prescottella equi]ERN47540.1 oxidoreductase [Prescottella equi NBRC 101255 = C 7]MBM4627131.1 FAD-binding protein [Prescottella equi]MBM4628017.1 FAD-binding protein [Prescottella equi]ORL25050.1 FAD-linked oxidase [Prescottella equi]ORL97304.1 FAD-linked oxidase [Prescottella equi]
MQTLELVDALAAVVGRAHVLTDPDVVAGYVIDWTGHWVGRTRAVVRPADTEQVAAVLRVCHRAGVAVVPQGGNTGLVGGSVPMEGEVVLSTARLTRIEQVDPVGLTIAAGAGVTVARAQQAAREIGLDLGIDLASRDTATLGGIVSTNAGGIRMIKNGNTRHQLLGIEAVLADGRILTRWKELTKDNVGYDLPGLLAGAEGTLAVITRVLMRLVVPSRETQVALVGVDDVGAALEVTAAAQRAGLTLEAAELMTRAGVDLVRSHCGLRAPLDADAPFYLLVEVSGQDSAQDVLFGVLQESADSVLDAVVEEGPAHRLWRYREGHTESVGAESTTPPLKLDLSTPLREIESFLTALGEDLADAAPAVRAICFGHLGDGNIHVNLLDVAVDQREAITDLVLRRVTRHNGSISAEHGVGRAKALWIGLGRTEVDLDVMRSIRAALDPAHLLNPHILPAGRA